MRIRFEVAYRKTWGWPYFVQRARKAGRYVARKDGLHVVTVGTMDAAVEVWQAVRSWKMVWYRVDGRVVGGQRFDEFMRRYQFRDLTQRWMLDEIIEKKAASAGYDERWRRWRMGNGPRPEDG